MRWELQTCPGCPGPPAQCAQSVAPFLCFPPSLLSSSLRYLTLGRNVRRRNMSTQELWVLPRALVLPRSFCFYSHWHNMIMLGEGCGHRLLGYNNVEPKVAPYKFLLFSFVFSPKESCLIFTVLQNFFLNLSCISQFNTLLEIQVCFWQLPLFCPFRNYTGLGSVG